MLRVVDPRPKAEADDCGKRLFVFLHGRIYIELKGPLRPLGERDVSLDLESADHLSNLLASLAFRMFNSDQAVVVREDRLNGRSKGSGRADSLKEISPSAGDGVLRS